MHVFIAGTRSNVGDDRDDRRRMSCARLARALLRPIERFGVDLEVEVEALHEAPRWPAEERRTDEIDQRDRRDRSHRNLGIGIEWEASH